MAGLRGNQAWFAAKKQTAKGTAGAAPLTKQPFSGGSIGPTRETDRLAETDAQRDQAAAYVTMAAVEGTPELYVRDATIPQYLSAAFGSGSVASSGTTNYTHVITPQAALDYYTFWRNIGGTSGLYEKFTDCFVSSIAVSAEAGKPLTAAVGIQGITAERLVADPASGVSIDSAAVYNYNDACGLLTLGGVSTKLISSFEFTLENNVTKQQTDCVQPYDLATGMREISLGFDIIFESLDEYNKFHYGGAAGTTVSRNIFTTSAAFVFNKGANNEVKFDFPSIAYEEFPVEPNVGGEPVVVSCRAVAQRATGVPNLVTATVKNQIATY